MYVCVRVCFIWLLGKFEGNRGKRTNFLVGIFFEAEKQ